MPEPSWFRLYARLPVWAQNAGCCLAGLRMRRDRYSRTFRAALDFLKAAESWSLEDLRAYQDEQLRRTVRHAYDNVPYYREVFDERKLSPDDVRTVEDLPKLPLLEKATLRRRYDDLQARGWPRRRIVRGRTGGTTGTALRLTSDRDTQPWQWAVVWRHRARFGLVPGDSFVVFAGRSVVPLSQTGPPIWRRNLPMHQTYVSVHHMTDRNLAHLVGYLRKRPVAYYTGYPSALYRFATFLLDNDLSLEDPPRITVSASETLLPRQRRVIEEALKTEVTDHYGVSEQCVCISECERHRYHLDMEFGVTELLALEGGPPKLRRIVCTGFRNPVMPLIRYDIGDLATESDRPCPCGRAAPAVESIDGRIESYIVTPDGRVLGRLGFLFWETHTIREAQLVQDDRDHLTVRVVRADGYTESDERRFLADLRRYVGPEMRIDMEHLPEIPREPNGKFRQIVSHVFEDRHARLAPAAGPAAPAGERP